MESLNVKFTHIIFPDDMNCKFGGGPNNVIALYISSPPAL